MQTRDGHFLSNQMASFVHRKYEIWESSPCLSLYMLLLHRHLHLSYISFYRNGGGRRDVKVTCTENLKQARSFRLYYLFEISKNATRLMLF